MRNLRNFIVIITLLLIQSNVNAQVKRYQPFVLASNSSSSMGLKVPWVKAELQAQGFKVIGEYTPQEHAHIFVITHPLLLDAAQNSSLGNSFAAAQRVSVTAIDGKTQVAFFNPEYMAIAYRIKNTAPYRSIKTLLESTLGTTSVGEFGATKRSRKGMTARKLKKYHYAAGMEYFDDFYTLAKYNSYKKATAEVEKALRAQKGNTFKIYRLDIPNQNRTLFGVGLTQGFSGDAKILSTIDKKTYRHTAHLPYEILVDNHRVIALHARFRIAISWPTLKMIGAVSFLKIMKTPEAIEKALTLGAGGTWEFEAELDDFDF